jgi:5,5'-dehydrodivanillate O-demethylase
VIADRVKENLASSDQGIIMLRKMIRASIEAVREGKDPYGVIRDPADNQSITFDSSRDAVAALG